MNIIVRFYWQHDLDLVALNMHPDFHMSKWMKKAVCAYANQTPLVIPLPSAQPYSVELGNCYTHFVLVPGKDDAAIQAMIEFRTGFRNNALKNIFRSYLETPMLDPYFHNDMYVVKSRSGKKKNKPAGRVIKRPSVIVPQPESPIATTEPAHTLIKEEPKEIILPETNPPSNDDDFDFFDAIDLMQ